MIIWFSDGKFLLGDIDIRSDLPKYRVFEDGVLVTEVTDVRNIWRDDFVTFLIGLSNLMWVFVNSPQAVPSLSKRRWCGSACESVTRR